MKLVTSLLEFSRIEAGRVTASYVQTDVALLTVDGVNLDTLGTTFVIN